VERNKEIQEERRLASYALIQISSQPSDRPRALIRATSSATSKSSWKMKGGGNSKGDKEGRHNQLLIFVCQGRPEGQMKQVCGGEGERKKRYWKGSRGGTE
jgi:hypothetical protein